MARSGHYNHKRSAAIRQSMGVASYGADETAIAAMTKIGDEKRATWRRAHQDGASDQQPTDQSS